MNTRREDIGTSRRTGNGPNEKAMHKGKETWRHPKAFQTSGLWSNQLPDIRDVEYIMAEKGKKDSQEDHEGQESGSIIKSITSSQCT